MSFEIFLNFENNFLSLDKFKNSYLAIKYDFKVILSSFYLDKTLYSIVLELNEINSDRRDISISIIENFELAKILRLEINEKFFFISKDNIFSYFNTLGNKFLINFLIKLNIVFQIEFDTNYSRDKEIEINIELNEIQNLN